GATNSGETEAIWYQSLGRSLRSQGRFSDARAAWFHALELLAQQTMMHSVVSNDRKRWCDCANDAAWFLATVPDPALQDPVRAISLALKAIEAYPECSTYWNTLGAAYYHAGDFKATVTALDRSIALPRGGTAFDHFFLAMAHQRLKHHEQAQRSFAQAM